MKKSFVAPLLGVATLGAYGCAAQHPTSDETRSSLSMRVRAEATELIVDFPNGRTLRSRDLIGQELTLAEGGLLRIDRVERNATKGLWEHEFSYKNAANPEWRNPCNTGPDGRKIGFPVHQYAVNPEETDRERFILACSAGSNAKCLRFGYLYWRGPGRTEADALEMYRACGRMVRADYCGDGYSTTLDGTTIDMYDDQGIQKKDPSLGLFFEAGWTSSGAVCVNHPRIAQNITLEQIAELCPNLRNAPLGEACTEDEARRRGAVIFDESAR